MVKIERPIAVRREAHARPLAPSAEGLPPVTIDDVKVEAPEVLVIGAGPGGLSAAIAARQAGAEVVVIDERSMPGGQYFKQVTVDDAGVMAPDAQHRRGAALIDRALQAGVTIRSGVTVWGAFHPGGFAATSNGRSLRYTPKAAIVATGAYERGWPVPGWTLPGVMTTGAAQTLWRTARRLPGKRVLVAGNGPLNLQVATELLSGGAQVIAVVEAAPRPGLAQLGALTTMLSAAPGLIWDGLRYHAARRAGGTPMIHGAVVAEVTQRDGALRVRLSDGRTLDTDVLCLGYGFEPSNELLRALGCGHDFDPRRRQLVTRRDAGGRTDKPGIYALGDCTGLGGAPAAMAEGALVGFAAAADLGHAIGSLSADRQQAERDLNRHRRFQTALWQLYDAPAYTSALATPDTIICRCEEVTFGQIEAALAEQMSQIGAVKRRTRLGMGRCQGRYCAPVLDALLAERTGRPRDEFSGFAPRVPVKPVAIGDLARLDPP
jgi:D-hydroxyproline dehydrogenase subunit alpha